MGRRSPIDFHHDRLLIDHQLANGVSLSRIARTHSVSISSLCRRRQRLRQDAPNYLDALVVIQPPISEIARRHKLLTAQIRALQDQADDLKQTFEPPRRLTRVRAKLSSGDCKG